MPVTIKQIQFKRGSREDLEALLVGDNIPKEGEPVFEELAFGAESNRLKFGDGIHTYAELPYFNTSKNVNFAIHDPVVNDILIFDATLGEGGSWVNRPFVDDKSITASSIDGASLVRYKTAANGTFPVKDTEVGLKWIRPVTDASLLAAVDTANAAVVSAQQSATKAASEAANAHIEYVNAENVKTKIMSYFNSKFWFGSVEEYNALPVIEEGTIYFITTG